MPYAPERRTVEAFEAAVRKHAWIGGAHPGDHLKIERHRKKAKLLALLGFEYVIPIEAFEDDE